MRVALDTNILAYAEGVNGAEQAARALAVLGRFPRREIAIPVQVLGELFNVLVRKAGREPRRARDTVLAWAEGGNILPTDPETLADALELAAAHRLGVWDSVVLAAAARAGCEEVLSEDFQHGFARRGAAVRNPFRP